MCPGKVPATLQELQTEKSFSVNEVLYAVNCKRPLHTLNDRQEKVVNVRKLKVKGGCDGRDVFIDIAKSEARVPVCTNATSCIVPNSRPYRLLESRILQPEEVMALQGIWEEDFPALSSFAQKKMTLVRDLAGNAFTTTVCMAVLIAALTHGMLPDFGTQPAAASDRF